MNSQAKWLATFGVVAITVASCAFNASAAPVYDVTTGQHHPEPLNNPQVPNTEVAGNPAASNPWIYGGRKTTTTSASTIATMVPTAFAAYTRSATAGADVMGGPSTFGDLNTWDTPAANGFYDTGTVTVVDGLNGVGIPTHDVAAALSYLRGQVHIATDDNSPINGMSIVRFQAPVTGTYGVALNLENRMVATTSPTRDAFYHVYTDKGGVLSLLTEGRFGPGPATTGLGPGSGSNINVVSSIFLNAGEGLEIAGSTGGVVFPQGLFALSGTVTLVPEPASLTLLAFCGVAIFMRSRRRSI